MNVALPALIVFLVLLPGFIFRARFKRTERTSLDFSPFGHVAAGAVLTEEAVLYTGVLDNFYFDPDGHLDRLVLLGVARRPIARDKNADTGDVTMADRFYPIDGDAFVLRYSEIVTLNVQYVHLAPPAA